jgi:hypothetical protein
MSYFTKIGYSDTGSLDAFSRLRVSSPNDIFTIQSQYNANSLQLESGNTGTGVAPAYDSNTRMVTLSATAGSGTSFLQSFQYHPYQPGRSQFIAMTGVIGTGVANTTVDIGYFDANNGVIFRQNGLTDLRFILRTSTSGSVSDANAVIQSSWNLDKLDGTGSSGITLDISKAFILVIDLQFLGMGRVRIGFDINGVIYYAHQFLNANSLTVPYMQSASLPIGMLITATSSATTKTSYFKCADVQSEGGDLNLLGYSFSTLEGTVTAGSGSRTHILSIRPKTTFNSITNRELFILETINLLATGANPVYWELVIGATLSGTAYSDVNTTYSGYEYTSTVGTFTNLTSGLVIASGYIGGAGTGGGANPVVTVIEISPIASLKFPIALNRAGAVTALGTLSLLVSGIGGSSATRASFNFREIR